MATGGTPRGSSAESDEPSSAGGTRGRGRGRGRGRPRGGGRGRGFHREADNGVASDGRHSSAGSSRSGRGGSATSGRAVAGSIGASSSGGGRRPGQRFPTTPWASEMCKVLRDHLRTAFAEGGGASRSLRFGTDCAGAEAPVFALREIVASLREAIGLDLRPDHVFACDIMPASRKFIMQNCPPEALFADLLARSAISHCMLTERPRLFPGNLDIYIAGFPCKDFSMLNKFRPCLDGPHASIFHGVVRHITTHEPRAFILENVQGLAVGKHGCEAPIAKVMDILRAIPNYEVRGWKVNTEDFFLPQHRARIYIVGVHTKKAKLRLPLSAWRPILESLKQEPSNLSHDYFLDNEEPEIVAEYERLCFKQDCRAVGARVGTGGQNWRQHHTNLRTKLGLGQRHRSHLTGWADFLGERMKDGLDIVFSRIARARGRPAEETQAITEIGRGVLYTSIMYNISPCVTPTGCLWVSSSNRWLMGKEMLALQGFPVDSLDFRGLSNSEVRTLAGNAMSVPVIGAFLYLVLALVAFPDDGHQALGAGSQSELEPQTPPGRAPSLSPAASPVDEPSPPPLPLQEERRTAAQQRVDRVMDRVRAKQRPGAELGSAEAKPSAGTTEGADMDVDDDTVPSDANGGTSAIVPEEGAGPARADVAEPTDFDVDDAAATAAEELTEGSVVVLTGLRAAAFNGKRGRIQSRDVESGRFIVLLDGGDEGRFRHENMRAVTQEAMQERLAPSYVASTDGAPKAPAAEAPAAEAPAAESSAAAADGRADGCASPAAEAPTSAVAAGAASASSVAAPKAEKSEGDVDIEDMETMAPPTAEVDGSAPLSSPSGLPGQSSPASRSVSPSSSSSRSPSPEVTMRRSARIAGRVQATGASASGSADPPQRLSLLARGHLRAAPATGPPRAETAAAHRPRRQLKASEDPFGVLPFPLLRAEGDGEGPAIQCDGCQAWLYVHEEVLIAYKNVQHMPFLCSYLSGRPCPSGRHQGSRIHMYPSSPRKRKRGK